MIEQKLFIEKYNWHLTVLYKANQDLSVVAEQLLFLQCPSKIAIRAIRDVIVERNNGFCFTNDLFKSTLMCAAEADSDEEFVNTIAHEVKHLQSHISSYYGIDEKSEEAAYLVGDTFGELFGVFKFELNIYNNYGRRNSFKKQNKICYKTEQQSGDNWFYFAKCST